ncbi:intraflagellar transport protein 56-like isoform X2 [Patiria miniata]|uniref:Uncharacterized protein n=1 Tax=Patiria miniata TaxID=46514 RepID=A0A913ZBM1_PATMI|nr:intraflagellar transport protein 56-like isoform X2 [Patiria miniata]
MWMLSRQKPATGPGSSTPAQESKKKKQLPKLEEYLDCRDYTGAFTSLEMGQFYYAAKAFDVLERLDPNPEYWEGKRGACVGVFQQIIAGHEPRETLRDILQILRNTGNPQVEYIIRVMKKWAKDNRVPVS